MGEANVTTAGGADLAMANNVAREMVYRCGFSARLGPVALMDSEEVYLNRERTRSVANISTPLARIAMEEVQAVRQAPARCCVCTSDHDGISLLVIFIRSVPGFPACCPARMSQRACAHLPRRMSVTFSMAACVQLLDGAEAKAYWGLALNYKPLQALVDVLVAEETINGERLTEVGTRSSCSSRGCDRAPPCSLWIFAPLQRWLLNQI